MSPEITLEYLCVSLVIAGLMVGLAKLIRKFPMTPA